MQIRYVLITLSSVASCYQASAMDLWTFRGACKSSTVKQDSSHADMNNIQGSAISCDAGFIMELGNGRKLVQFGLKGSEVVPPGFSGGEFKHKDGHYALILDTVYPQRVTTGKTTEQIYAETMKTAMPTEGYCIFSDSDFNKLTEISCTTQSENADRKIFYNVTFEITNIAVKRYDEGSNRK